MALVVLLRGVNVGGHRIFRPAALAKQLRHLDVVNIWRGGDVCGSAAGHAVATSCRAGLKLPAGTEVIVCEGREIVRLMAAGHFANQPIRRDIVRFITVLSRRPRSTSSMPMNIS